ncbi:MAG TPA: trypsin-like peptidase domain-containing protein [Thermoanaerobaculia bacterium]|nr:trypsin-like peptidase domain-containing protein [Thermoanaerobaculia bacterium]
MKKRFGPVGLWLAVAVQGLPAAPLPSRRSDIVEVVEKVAPAVVNIAAEQTVRPERSLFDGFFFGLDRRPAKSLGSGVIIDPKGIILTNDHVISGASKILATTKSGQELECEVVGSDADNDLAVLRVKKGGSALPTIHLGTSSDLMIGETVVAIGNPFGLSNTVTAGVLSALGRSVPGENQRVYNDFIQIDAPINPGNSGGPVVNIRGDMIGVATAIIGGAQGIGFAIPVDRAKRIVADLVRFGHVQPVWIGLHGRTVTSREDEDRPRGFRVRSVEPDSPAARAGIRAGDQIVSVDNTLIDSEEAFETALSTRGPGRSMKIVLKNASGERAVTLSGQMPPPDYGVRLLREELGMTVRPARGGLRISIVNGRGAAARAGLESGDLLLGLNGTEVSDAEDVNKIIARDHSRTTLWMTVGRGAWQYTLTFPLD